MPIAMHSSNTRGKFAFLPWMAALVIGATAHSGWLIHELRHTDAPPLIVEVDARPHERSRSHTPARCRHAPSELSPALSAVESAEPFGDLDLWVRQTARHVYAIDRQMFARVALSQIDARALERLQALGDGERGPKSGTIELRNIRRGTPLYMLGLRNGDRVLAIATLGRPAIERVAVTIERRGHPLALVYEII
jgi:hypothetical protein